MNLWRFTTFRGEFQAGSDFKSQVPIQSHQQDEPVAYRPPTGPSTWDFQHKNPSLDEVIQRCCAAGVLQQLFFSPCFMVRVFVNQFWEILMCSLHPTVCPLWGCGFQKLPKLRCKKRHRSSEKNSCCNKKWCLHQALKWKWTYNINVLWLSISLQKKHVILLLFHNDVFHPCFNGDLSSKGRKKSGVKPLLPCHPGTWSGIDLGPKFEQAIGKLLPLSSMQVNGR